MKFYIEKKNQLRVSSTQSTRANSQVSLTAGTRSTEAGTQPLQRLIGFALWELIKLRSVSKNPARKKNPSATDCYFGRIISIFLEGCRLALRHENDFKLRRELNTYKDDIRGFAFEGAAMGLSLLDLCVPSARARVTELEEFRDRHIYMTYVGLGWTVALCRISVKRAVRFVDPLLAWLIIDGCGFYHGFFNRKQCIDGQRIPGRFSAGYASRAFDQGVGRSLWFAHQGDVDKINKTIGCFASDRRSDLWSGIGLACSYAGGAKVGSSERLLELASEFRLELAQGAAFATAARRRAHTPALHTDMACETFCKMSSEKAAMITEMCRDNVSARGAEPAYEVWRKRIRAKLSTTWRR